jgi:hypothetical protein
MLCVFEVIAISMSYSLLSKHRKRINKKDLTYLDKVEEYLELLKYCINYLNDKFNTQLPNYFNSKENILNIS